MKQASSIFRALLTIAGGLLLGHNLFGQKVDESLIQELTGGAMALFGIVLSYLDKTETIEKLEGAIRQICSVAGGILVAKNIISAQTLAAIVSIIIILVPLSLGKLATKKTKALDNGKILIQDLKK